MELHVLERHVIMQQQLIPHIMHVKHIYHHVQLLELEVAFQELLAHHTQHHHNVETKIQQEVVAIGVLLVYHVSI